MNVNTKHYAVRSESKLEQLIKNEAEKLKTKNIMIQEVKFLSIVCDGCKKLLGDDQEESLWSYKTELEEYMNDMEWIKAINTNGGDMHFCDKCKIKSI